MVWEANWKAIRLEVWSRAFIWLRAGQAWIVAVSSGGLRRGALLTYHFCSLPTIPEGTEHAHLLELCPEAWGDLVPVQALPSHSCVPLDMSPKLWTAAASFAKRQSH